MNRTIMGIFIGFSLCSVGNGVEKTTKPSADPASVARKAIGALLAAAFEETRQITDKSDRDLAFCNIAVAQAVSGDVAEAETTATKVSEPINRTFVSCRIAKQKAKSGDKAGALKYLAIAKQATLERTDNAAWTVDVYCDIAEIEIELGDNAEARKSLQKSVTALPSVMKLYGSRVAENLAKAGDMQAAKNTASQLNDSDQSFTFAEIAKIQLAQGDLAGARTTVAQIPEKSIQDMANGDIVEAQFKSGESASAFQTADGIKGKEARSRAYFEIAKIQADRGQFKEALATTSKIGDASWQTISYETIADFQWKKKDKAGAIRTLNTAETAIDQSHYTDEYVSIAWERAEIGDIAGAKATLAKKKIEKYENERVVRRIVNLHIKFGDIPTAKALAESNAEPIGLYIDIAEAEAQRGDMVAARHMLEMAKSEVVALSKESMPNLSGILAEKRQNIFESQAKIGDVAGAIEYCFGYEPGHGERCSRLTSAVETLATEPQ